MEQDLTRQKRGQVNKKKRIASQRKPPAPLTHCIRPPWSSPNECNPFLFSYCLTHPGRTTDTARKILERCLLHTLGEPILRPSRFDQNHPNQIPSGYMAYQAKAQRRSQSLRQLSSTYSHLEPQNHGYRTCHKSARPLLGNALQQRRPLLTSSHALGICHGFFWLFFFSSLYMAYIITKTRIKGSVRVD